MSDLHKSKPFVWALFIIFCVVWFYTLGARTLVPTDEGRYAEMAREMVATGDWITPRLDAIKYFEKPPLQTWMNALTFEAFGLGEWQARLWTGLCGLFGVVLVAYTGRKVFNPWVGFASGLVLASSFWWAAFGHINTLDMGLSGMMTLSLCALLLAQRDNAAATARRNWMLACWAGMALAVMSKGLIGIVLPGAVLVLYSLLTRDWAIWKRLHLGLGLLLFFAMTTPWFVLISIRNPEFPKFFFIHEHFQRFTSTVHHRAGPWYYFIPFLMIGIVPWLGVLLQSAWAARRDIAKGFQPRKMLLIWAVFIFVFFSISDSKLPSYILPIFPAFALLIAVYLEAASRTSWAMAAGLMAAIGASGLALAWRLPQLATDPLQIPNYQASQPWVLAASLIMLAAGLLVLWWVRQKRTDLATVSVIALAVSGFIGGQLLMLGYEPHGRYRAGLALVAAIAPELAPGTPLYSVGLYEQTLPFYLRRTMTLVQHPDELEFGLSQEPQLWLPKLDTFIEKWQHAPKAIAVTRPAIYEQLKQRGVPMRVIAQDPQRVVITNDLK